MAPKEFPEFKYTAGTPGGSAFLKILLVIAGFLILIAAIIVTPLFFIALPVPIIVLIRMSGSGPNNSIFIGGRYLIVGNMIVYYTNIVKARLDKNNHSLTITSSQGRDLVIDAQKFPTNARKPDKIRKNKTDKFNKAAEKIMARIRETAPQAIS